MPLMEEGAEPEPVRAALRQHIVSTLGWSPQQQQQQQQPAAPAEAGSRTDHGSTDYPSLHFRSALNAMNIKWGSVRGSGGGGNGGGGDDGVGAASRYHREGITVEHVPPASVGFHFRGTPKETLSPSIHVFLGEASGSGSAAGAEMQRGQEGAGVALAWQTSEWSLEPHSFALTRVDSAALSEASVAVGLGAGAGATTGATAEHRKRCKTRTCSAEQCAEPVLDRSRGVIALCPLHRRMLSVRLSTAPGEAGGGTEAVRWCSYCKKAGGSPRPAVHRQVTPCCNLSQPIPHAKALELRADKGALVLVIGGHCKLSPPPRWCLK